jgi:hypothetical protein
MVLVQEIQDLLKTKGSLKRQELLNTLYRGLSYGEQQFNEALRILQQAEIVSINEKGKYYLSKEVK